MKGEIMKKILTALLVGSVLFTFSACHGDEKIDHPTDGTYHETRETVREDERKTSPADPDWDENTGTLDFLPTSPGDMMMK